MTIEQGLLIAIPTYNEAENVGTLVPTLLELHPAAHILVIDDNSADGTGDVVAKLAIGDGRIHLIRRPGKLGLGSAYQAAFAWALARGYSHVSVMDADFSHAPAQLGRLLDAAGSADVVVGSRYVAGGRIENWPLPRLALSRAANVAARMVAGSAVRDWTAGFKCYAAPVLKSLEADPISSEGYSFQIEILFRCRRAGFTIREVPITFIDRRAGESKMSRAEVYQAARTLLRLAWQRITSPA